MRRLDVSSANFAAEFDALVDARREAPSDVSARVAAIIADVRERGDEALIELTRRFDRLDLTPATLAVPHTEIDAALKAIGTREREALELAAARIRTFHEAQKPADDAISEANGTRMGWRYTPIEAAGIYVPGGLASYPSSLLMNAVPARVAGVETLVVATPAPDGEMNPMVLAAARLAGVDRIYRIGGAQAIAALAFGTESIARVDKITGPGNAYVAEAKRQLYGRVGIDMVAGPSEILIVADADADAAIVSADLLAQAEHDAGAQSVLITDCARLADQVADMIAQDLAGLPSGERGAESWQAHGAIILIQSLEGAPALVDRLAPEHLALMVAEPATLFAEVRHAGSVFMGYLTPEAIGDYVAGPNHILPTGRRARFSSGLGTADFMKRTTFLSVSKRGLAEIGPAAAVLAEAEGLPAHALSVRRRLGS